MRSAYYPYDPLVNGVFVNLPRNTNYGESSPYVATNLFAALTWSHQFDKDWSIKQQIAFNDNAFDFNSGFSSFPFPIITNPFPLVLGGTATGVRRFSTYSTDVDIVGHINTFGAEHTLLLGGDYYNSRGYFNDLHTGYALTGLFNPTYSASFLNCQNYSVSPEGPCTPLYSVAGQTTAGLYLQDQVKLPYDFFLMAGARYQYIDQTGSSGFGTGPNYVPETLPLSAQALTPRFGLLWRPQKWLSLYGNYAEGFGPQPAGTLVYPGQFAPPTSAKSWEAGAKLEFLDGKLRISADYFELVKTNVPYPDTNPAHNCGFGFASCSLIAGAARSTGPEIDIYGELLPGWSVTANYTNTDARFTQVANGTNNPAGPGVGQRFYGVPRNQANLFTTYEFQSNSVLKGLKIGAGYHYVGSKPVGDFLNPPWVWPLVPSYGTVDLMAAYSWSYAGSKMTAQVNVTNLFDRTYYTGIAADNFLAPGVQTPYFRSYGAPFAVMGSLRAELDEGATPSPWLLPVATAAPSLPAFTWTGLYVGGQMGYGWGDNNGSVSWATAQGRDRPGRPRQPYRWRRPRRDRRRACRL